jgi:N-glycosylase/DNA lyase
MEMRLSSSNPFNLDFTLCCGQAFRWDKRDNWWYGVAREKVLKVRQAGEELEFENVDTDFLENYFGLQDDLPKILSHISKDSHIKQAVDEFKGLRIVRQDPWECLISYICATYKNIPAIRQMLFNLCRKFGDRISFERDSFYAFPSPQTLAKTTAAELAKCGLGYRANYVIETAKKVYKEDFDLERVREMPYEEAKEALLDFPGVGSKVADCTLLFSLGNLEAFPIDVWIKRIILKYYPSHFPKEFVEKISRRKSITPSEYEKLNRFGRTYFGKYAGYAQEYLYHHERTQR